jgi:hypothetical protein
MVMSHKVRSSGAGQQPPQTLTGTPSRAHCQSCFAQVRDSTFIQSNTLLNVYSSGLNSENSLREATRIFAVNALGLDPKLQPQPFGGPFAFGRLVRRHPDIV